MNRRSLLVPLCGAILAGVLGAQIPTRLPTGTELTAFDLQGGLIQQLEVVAPTPDVATIRGERRFQVELGGVVRDVVLTPKDVRAPNFRLLVDEGNGALVEIPAPASTTYVGEVVGQPSRVAVSIVDGAIHGMIALESTDQLYGIQPLQREIPEALAGEHAVYEVSDVAPQSVQCGNTEVPVIAEEVEGQTAPFGIGTVVAIAELACDADFQFYQDLGSSTTAVQNEITMIVNNVNVIYTRDVGIEHSITQIIVRTSSGSNPYTSNDAGTLLGQFQNHWISSQGSVPRDIAHLFTGRSLIGSTIGVAFLGGVCSGTFGYGLSERFTGNLTSLTGLTAHEIGHNWNASHCSGSDCRIMCAGLGGCSGDITAFGAVSQSSITSFRNSRFCLDTPPPPAAPTLSSTSPTSVQAFLPPSVTINGSNLSSVTSLRVNGVPVNVLNWQVVSDTQISWTPRNLTSLGIQLIDAVNTVGTSNFLPLNVTQTSPPDHFATPITSNNLPYVLEVGGAPGDAWYALIAVDDVTFEFGPLTILLNNAVLAAGTLNGAGLGSFSITVPPSPSLSGLSLRSQMIILGSVFTVTPIRTTTFF
jgi:hypothetical protein